MSVICRNCKFYENYALGNCWAKPERGKPIIDYETGDTYYGDNCTEDGFVLASISLLNNKRNLYGDCMLYIKKKNIFKKIIDFLRLRRKK